MDELVNLIVKKTGINHDQAQEAVEIVIDYLKERLPEPLAVQIDGVLEGQGVAGSLDDFTKGLGGFLGKK